MVLATKVLVSEAAICAKYIWSFVEAERLAHKQADPRKEMLMIRKSIWILGVALLFVGVVIVSQPAALAEDVTMTLEGVTTSGENLGGVYTSPYQISVDGSTTLSLLACDDFTTDISMGYEWSADVYTLADVENTGPQKFTTPTGPVTVYGPDTSVAGTGGPQAFTETYTASQEYYAAAVLADAVLYDNLSTSAAEEYSFAIWQIFYKNAYLGYNESNELTQGERQDVSNDMSYALGLAEIDTPLGYTLDIYTPCGGPGGCGTEGLNGLSGTAVSQEFLGITVPEGSALATLAFDLFVLFGGIFLLRKRVLRNAGVPR